MAPSATSNLFLNTSGMVTPPPPWAARSNAQPFFLWRTFFSLNFPQFSFLYCHWLPGRKDQPPAGYNLLPGSCREFPFPRCQTALKLPIPGNSTMTHIAVARLFCRESFKCLSSVPVLVLQLTFILFPSHRSITLIYSESISFLASLMKEILSFPCSLVGWVLYFWHCSSFLLNSYYNLN